MDEGGGDRMKANVGISLIENYIDSVL